jgi:UDP-glucose 4-epimerase
MRVLVTGGAGFIGSNLVSELVAREHTVTVLDNLQSGYRQNLDAIEGVTFIEGDIRNATTVSDAMAGAEVVFHLAASVGNKRSIDFPIDDAEINVLGTLRVLEAARHHRVRRLVVSSSAGIFGELKTLPIREDHPIEPDSPYGCTKLAEEKLALSYAKLYGIGVTCLRYFNVYGPNQRFDAYGNVIPIFVFKALRRERITIFGDGEQTRDFVNVRDVVQANLRAASSDAIGAYNIGSSTAITLNNMVQLLEQAFGCAIEKGYDLPRPGDVRHSLADISAARAAFGFAPSVSLDAGLQTYVNWARGEVGKL